MAEKEVAAPSPYDLEAEFLENPNQFLTLEPGNAAHREIC
jgi:hypothetical protein